MYMYIGLTPNPLYSGCRARRRPRARGRRSGHALYQRGERHPRGIPRL